MTHWDNMAIHYKALFAFAFLMSMFQSSAAVGLMVWIAVVATPLSRSEKP
jgi:hypothetical protein